MTVMVGDIYRNEEGLWLVFGFKEKEEGGRVLLIKDDPTRKRTNEMQPNTVMREIDPEDLIGEYALAKANESKDAVVAWHG